MLCLLSGPQRFNCLIFFCSGIQLYVLFSPFFCFISFLYIHLYVIEYYSVIGLGSFIEAEHLCVLINIRIEGGVDAVELL